MSSRPKFLDAIEDDVFEDDYDDTDNTHERDDDGDDVDSYDDDPYDASEDSQEVQSAPANSDAESLQKQIQELKKRFAGQSRRINYDSQRYATLERRYQDERRELLEALLHERIQDLPPDEQKEKVKEFHLAYQQEQALHQYSGEREMMLAALKTSAIKDIASRYGVAEEELAELPDADTMEWFAAREARRRKKEQQTQKRDKRRVNKSDPSDTRRQTSAPPKEPKTLDEAENAFLRAARRR